MMVLSTDWCAAMDMDESAAMDTFGDVYDNWEPDPELVSRSPVLYANTDPKPIEDFGDPFAE